MNIDLILKKQGITKKYLAEKMGMSRENLHRVLTGNPTLSNIEKLAAALNVPVWQLFTETGNLLNGYVEYNGKIYRVTCFEDLQELLNLAE